MNEQDNIDPIQWFAVRTRQEKRAYDELSTLCEEVFYPVEEIKAPDGRKRMKSVIPHVLFIRTTRKNALSIESAGRKSPESNVPVWIYRYPDSNEIQVIGQSSIELLRLLTAHDTTRCKIYTVKHFTIGQRVKVTGGIFKGYEGFVKRIGKNKHVIVSIEGLCMVILPYIHPDLLEII